jgi:SAM-dependent methyltransferase
MTDADLAPPPARRVDWRSWLARWDAQQTGYLPDREARFDAMLDALDVLLPPTFVALDLACGPGALSERIARRFPEARAVAVDTDPVLLALGQGALGTLGGRVSWHKLDLTERDWAAGLPVATFDAVLSTTALHWLAPDVLARVYRDLGALIRPGGLFLNGDHMAYPPHEGTFARLAGTLKERRRASAFSDTGAEDWETWWDALRAEPDLGALFEERERRFAWRDRAWTNPGYEFQVAALREAGFREVGTIWQRLDNRVLLAVR